jgi:hypothetical protein
MTAQSVTPPADSPFGKAPTVPSQVLVPSLSLSLSLGSSSNLVRSRTPPAATTEAVPTSVPEHAVLGSQQRALEGMEEVGSECDSLPRGELEEHNGLSLIQEKEHSLVLLSPLPNQS